MTRVDGRNRCSSASFTIERRGRKGRKEKLHFVAAFAQRSLFASDYRRPHSTASVSSTTVSVASTLRREFRALYGVSSEHSTTSVPSTLRRQFPSNLRR